MVPRANGTHHEARAAESVRLPRIWSTGLPICPPQGPKRFSKSSEGQIQEGAFWYFFAKPEGLFRGIHLTQNTQPPGPGTPISRSAAPCYIGIPENQVVWQQDLASHEEILIFSCQNPRIWVSPLTVRSPQGDSSREIRGELVGLSFSSACLTPKPQHARILVDLQHSCMPEAQPPNRAGVRNCFLLRTWKVWGPQCGSS